MATLTTRSRTGLFLSYRDSRAPARARTSRRVYDVEDNEESENERLIRPMIDTGFSVQAEVLPPTWVDISDQVEETLAGTQTKIQTLDKLHAKHVLPGFSDRSQEEREIEALTSDITRDFRICHTLIQKISYSTSHTFPPPGSKTESHHSLLAGKNVQRALAAKLQDLSAGFRRKQRVYLDKLQGHTTKAKVGQGQDLLFPGAGAGTGLFAEEEDVDAQASLQVQQSLTQDGSQTHLTQRTQEITQIASSISSLAELFKDLQVLVIDQGTLLDSVEWNIEQVSVRVEDAVEELKIATGYQKNTGKRKCIFLLALVIFGLVVVLIFKPRRHHPPLSPPPPGGGSIAEDTKSEVGHVAGALEEMKKLTPVQKVRAWRRYPVDISFLRT